MTDRKQNGQPVQRWLGRCVYCGQRIQFKAMTCRAHKDLLRVDANFSEARR